MPLENTIIYLIGFAGVGKFAVAKELAKLADFRIVHNHLVNDPVMNIAVSPNEMPIYMWDQIKKIRDIVYNTIEKYSPNEMNFIFTNVLIDKDSGDSELYNQTKELAEKRGGNFFPVKLYVSKEEHLKRVISPERQASFKASYPEYLEEIEGIDILKIKHKNLIEIDTTKLSAAQTAEYILNKIKEIIKCQ